MWMQFEYTDFNGADKFFGGAGAAAWSDLDKILSAPKNQLQASDQAGKIGTPIFDPKATNAKLTAAALARGWRAVAVPKKLQMFGKDWDSGKGSVLAEWQFSNYPFLWNNIIRSEAVFKGGTSLAGMQPLDALVVVTKSGRWPSSNSTLYYEQARAQIETVTALDVFEIPIRLVGLTLPPGTKQITAEWHVYPGRYSRAATTTTTERFAVRDSKRAKTGAEPVSLTKL